MSPIKFQGHRSRSKYVFEYFQFIDRITINPIINIVQSLKVMNPIQLQGQRSKSKYVFEEFPFIDWITINPVIKYFTIVGQG